MNWKEVCIHTSREALEPVSNVLYDLGISGLVIEDPLDILKKRSSKFGEIYDLNKQNYPVSGVYIKVYLPIEKDLEKKIENIKKSIDQLKQFDIDLGENKIILNEVKEEDWENAWKKYYKPVKITKRITIVPKWENYKPMYDEKIIKLDPGMAFGTGTHPTTMLSIQALEKYVEKNDTIIDVGCGSGILSIAACNLGAKQLYALDLDDVAVSSAKYNILLNELNDKICVKQNNLLNDIHICADVIVANILAEVIVTFIDQAWKCLKNNGLFITSGIIQSKRKLVIDHLMNSGFQIKDEMIQEDWVSIIAQKISS